MRKGTQAMIPGIKKILYANTFLTPNKNLTTNETGTRHQTAERTGHLLPQKAFYL